MKFSNANSFKAKIKNVAKANAIIMTILETAKRHHLNTEGYMACLLERLPNEPLFEKMGFWRVICHGMKTSRNFLESLKRDKTC
ncbi:transposase domain-containing protein [Aerococcaceae bacterium zg-BR22]|uniref:hypothetical protein n=1 Tax=Aerococcaceae bacterium zg-1292 TaxID=2774330 RepID=UPI0040632850|nr:transposase domain-containing protein [Aerococcaceae bacterium zg-BR22]